jgi:molybdopterin synthase sulfur carrier subunit
VPDAGYSLRYADLVARLLLFASAREAAGQSQDVIAGETVGEVLTMAKQRFGPRFESVLDSCTVWLNGEACEPDARVGATDEVAVLPPVSGGAHLGELSLDDLRAKRAALQSEEDAVSFVRRLVQGRLDIARDEVRRRSAGEVAESDITDGLTRVFSAERGTGSNRPPRDTDVVVDHPLLVELERLCDSVGFGGLRDLDDDELNNVTSRLAEFEQRMSARRKDLFAEIDVFSSELVRRYRSSTSDIDSLLDESH